MFNGGTAMKNQSAKSSKGFTLMELLIAIAIVGVLATIAIPSYLTYVRKSQFSEIVQSADTLKVAVANCAQTLATITGCSGGSQGIPPDVAAGAGVGQVDAMSIANGVITITPKASNGFLAADTYVLTPTYNVNGITWASSGGGCSKGYAPGC